MRRHLLLLVILLSVAVRASAFGGYSVNYDKKTVAAMVAAFGTETATEMYYSEQVKEILDRYSAAEVATAGIFLSKYLDRKALTELGIWSNPAENRYYRRIYSLVSVKIMPKIWTVAKMMLHSPQTALYWGSYLFKVCTEVKTLCMQFESIVTNSTLSFRDVVFLQIAPQFQPLFNLASHGDIDWQCFFDDLADVPGHFTKENLTSDIDRLYNMGVGIANAGMENMTDALLGGSSFHEIAGGKVSAILQAVESSHRFYQSLEQNMGGTLLSLVGGPENVANLFHIDNYDMTSWITDYLRENVGQYYTQRWYVYRRDAGTEVLCDYTPSLDDNSILYGGEWTRFNTADANFYPNSGQTVQIKANSENYAGWSQTRVNQLNAANDGFTYSIFYNRHAYILTRNSRQYAKSYAYAIRVTKNWNRKEEVYEDVFDSYTMDLGTFQRQLQARLLELNDNEEGAIYFIGSDVKNYYNTTDATKLKGTESVIISVTCHDGFTLMQGSTQYKCRSCGGSLNAHSKECAMQTSVSSENIDTSELDALESEYNSQKASLQAQINRLNAENQALVKQIASATVEEAVVLRQQYNENKVLIEKLTKELNDVERQLAELQTAREEAAAGEAVQTDDYYRIPAIMADCKIAFDLTWQDNGHWEGYSFVRTATSGSMDAVITFRASLKIARKPKYFLGIKIHRAIMQIDWQLTADYSDTQVVDVLQLDPNKSDKENAEAVNIRISEIAREYPSCTISTEYIKNEAPEQDTTNDTYHLLWSSDRLEIARQVETRLTHIYADLVSLEKMMHYKLSIVDVLKKAAPLVNDEQGKRQNIVEKSFSRWMKCAGSSYYQRKGESVQ